MVKKVETDGIVKLRLTESSDSSCEVRVTRNHVVYIMFDIIYVLC